MSLVNEYGLPLAALLVFITELGIPSGIPNEIPLLLIGAYHTHSLWALIGALAVVSTADLLGTTGLFLIIRSGGNQIANRLLRGHAGERLLEQWRSRLGRSARRDVEIVIGGRVLPLVRTPFTMTTALLGMRTRRFVLGAIPGSILWAGWPLTLGYLLRNRVDSIIGPIERGSTLLGGVFIIAIAVLASFWLVRSKIHSHHHANAH